MLLTIDERGSKTPLEIAFSIAIGLVVDESLSTALMFSM